MSHCAWGQHCRALDATGNPAQAINRGLDQSLCLACERHGQYAIRKLPTAYMALAEIYGKTYPTTSGGTIATQQPEAPILIRENVDKLMTDMVKTIGLWENEVRRHAHMTYRTQAKDTVVIARGTLILDRHYNTLLALPTQEFVLFSGNNVAWNGIDGIRHLTRLYHLAKVTVGVTERTERRLLPCPPQVDGCGMEELHTVIGDDLVTCANCGWHCTLDDYSFYVMSFVPRRGHR